MAKFTAKMLKTTLILLLGGMLPVQSLLAQGEGILETIVVTGVDSSSDEELPYLRKSVAADFVIFDFTLVNASLDIKDQEAQLKRVYTQFVAGVAATKGVTVFSGEANGAKGPIETSEFDELFYTYANKGRVSLVIQIEPNEGESFRQTMARLDTITRKLKNIGRTEWYTADSQFIGIYNPNQYHDELLEQIAAQTARLRTLFPDQYMVVEGLHNPVNVLPMGSMKVTVFIPHKFQMCPKQTGCPMQIQVPEEFLD